MTRSIIADEFESRATRYVNYEGFYTKDILSSLPRLPTGLLVGG